MPIRFRHTVKEHPGARLRFRHSLTTAASDTVKFRHEIDRHDFGADAWTQVGARVEMDLGDGVLSVLSQSHRPPRMSITGTLEGFGVRELTFGRIPGDSPLRTAWMMAPRRVKVTGIRGTLGGYREYDLFDGLLRSGEHALFPAESTLSAQDDSLLNQPLFFALAKHSYRTRRSIITDICHRTGIRPGTFEFVDAEDVGGYCMKAINEVGARSVLQFLAEFLIPTTCRAYWRGGTLNIKHFTPAAASKRTLTWSDLRSMRVIPRATHQLNTVRLASDLYPYVGPDLTGTYETLTYTSAAYTTAVATHKQDKTTGAITPLALSGTALATPRLAARTVVTYAGGTVTARTVETYGAYAPKAANKQQNADGSTRHNGNFDVFLFPDGTWRKEQEESWRIVHKTVTTRSFALGLSYLADGWHISDSTDLYTFHDWYAPVSLYNPAEVPVTDRYLTDDGIGWQFGAEELRHSASYRSSGAHDANTMERQAWYVEAFYPVGAAIYLPHGGAPTLSSFKFGPSASPINARLITAGAPAYQYRLERWKTTITKLSALSYRAVTAIEMARGSAAVGTGWVQAAAMPVISAASDVTVDEPVPLKERRTADQVTQPAAITTPSLSGADLAGKRLTRYAENAWCETRAEMTAAGLEDLRELAAIRVDVVPAVADLDLVEGDVITLPAHADFGHGPVNALIVSASVDFDGDGCRCDQRWECVVWPAEVV